jgi:hypothetical protein
MMPIRKSRHFVGMLAMILLLSVSTRAQQSPSCQFVSFKVTLNANENYQRELGGRLLFRVKSQKDLGWFVDIVPSEENTKDYIYPVNLPLRFNPNQTLGPGFGETVQSSLSHPHEMNFLLDRSDYERISALVPGVLSDPDKALAEYTNAVDHARQGSLNIAISSHKTNPRTGSPAHIKLRVGITTPPGFQFAPGLYPWPAPCHR